MPEKSIKKVLKKLGYDVPSKREIYINLGLARKLKMCSKTITKQYDTKLGMVALFKRKKK